jgi:hypothetical protein
VESDPRLSDALSRVLRKLRESEDKDDIGEKIMNIGLPIAITQLKAYPYCENFTPKGVPCPRCFERALPVAILHGATEAYLRLQHDGDIDSSWSPPPFHPVHHARHQREHG